MTDLRPPAATTGVVIAVVLAAIALSAGTGPAVASTPPLSCAGGDGGVRYTAGNLTVADASSATDDRPFTGDSAVTVGNVTVSADGAAFARVEQATDDACLSDVDATATPMTVETSDATLTVEGQFDALAFDDPTAGGDGIAYESGGSVTVTIADAGMPVGTTVEAVDDSGDVVTQSTVADDGSITLSLPASDGETSLGLQEAIDTDDETPDSDDGTSDSEDGTVDSDTATPDSDDETPDSDDETPASDDETMGSDDETSDSDSETENSGAGEATTAPGASDEQSERTTGGDDTETPGDSGPGFGIVAALFAILAVLVARR